MEAPGSTVLVVGDGRSSAGSIGPAPSRPGRGLRSARRVDDELSSRWWGANSRSVIHQSCNALTDASVLRT